MNKLKSQNFDCQSSNLHNNLARNELHWICNAFCPFFYFSGMSQCYEQNICLRYRRVEKLKICQLGYKLGNCNKATQKYSASAVLHILLLQSEYYKVYFFTGMNPSISRAGHKTYIDTVPGSFSLVALPCSAEGSDGCFCSLLSQSHPHCGWLGGGRERWRCVLFLEWQNPTLVHITCTHL